VLDVTVFLRTVLPQTSIALFHVCIVPFMSTRPLHSMSFQVDASVVHLANMTRSYSGNRQALGAGYGAPLSCTSHLVLWTRVFPLMPRCDI
jgi:hypothetical protein